MASRRRFYTSLVGLGYDSNEAPLDSGIATGHTSTALLRALERGGAMYLVEVDLPGMTLRIGTTAYDSNESGQYEPLVREIAGLSHQGPDRSSRMAGRQPSVRFDDSSRQFAQLTEGQQGPRLQGSPARIKIAHPQVRPEAWRTEFSGEVASWEFPSEFEAELILRPADRTLRRTTLVKPLGLSEWPNIGGPALGKYPPLLYGGHNSQVYTNTGLVPLLPVDTVNEYWLVSIGWTGVQRVYVEGLLTSEFDVIHLERKGRLYTVVKRTGTVAWEVEGRITADATGFESQGDGSGYLITNPAEQLSHVLVNFYFHEWRGGGGQLWFGADADFGLQDPMIESQNYVRSNLWFASRGYAGAFRLAEAIDGYTLATKWAQTHKARVSWTADGKIAIRIEDPNDQELYGLPVLRRGSDFSFSYDDQACTRSVTAMYAKSEADSRFLASQEVTDPTASDDNLQPETMDLDYSQVS